MFATPLKGYRREQQIFLLTLINEDFDALVRKGNNSSSTLMKFQDVDTLIISLTEILNNTNHLYGLPAFIIIDSRQLEQEVVSIISKLKSDARFCKIPVIVLVADEHQGIANQYYTAGVSSCLPIPDDPQIFSTLLNLTRDYWLRIVTLPS